MSDVIQILLAGGDLKQIQSLTGKLKKIELFNPLKINSITRLSDVAGKLSDIGFTFIIHIQSKSESALTADLLEGYFESLPGVPVLVLLNGKKSKIPSLDLPGNGIHESLQFSGVSTDALGGAMRNLFLLSRTHIELDKKILEYLQTIPK